MRIPKTKLTVATTFLAIAAAVSVGLWWQHAAASRAFEHQTAEARTSAVQGSSMKCLDVDSNSYIGIGGTNGYRYVLHNGHRVYFKLKSLLLGGYEYASLSSRFPTAQMSEIVLGGNYEFTGTIGKQQFDLNCNTTIPATARVVQWETFKTPAGVLHAPVIVQSLQKD